jgi:hypothetical protein
VLKPGGRLAFFTIHMATGLTKREQGRARRAGPPALATRRPYPQLLAAAGFTSVEAHDMSDEFTKTAASWFESRSRYEAELRATEGETEYLDCTRERRLLLAAARDGLLKRTLFTAERRSTAGLSFRH